MLKVFEWRSYVFKFEFFKDSFGSRVSRKSSQTNLRSMHKPATLKQNTWIYKLRLCWFSQEKKEKKILCLQVEQTFLDFSMGSWQAMSCSLSHNLFLCLWKISRLRLPVNNWWKKTVAFQENNKELINSQKSIGKEWLEGATEGCSGDLIIQKR